LWQDSREHGCLRAESGVGENARPTACCEFLTIFFEGMQTPACEECVKIIIQCFHALFSHIGVQLLFWFVEAIKRRKNGLVIEVGNFVALIESEIMECAKGEGSAKKPNREEKKQNERGWS
jgi:hypothetical protein